MASLAGVLVAGLVLVLTGCGGDDTPVGRDEQTTPPVPTPPELTATVATGRLAPSASMTEAPTPSTDLVATTVSPVRTTTSSSSWRTIAASPLGPRAAPVSVWTGSEFIVWSGIPATSDMCEDRGGGMLCGEPAVFDGAAYDPVTDTWRAIADGPVPAAGAPTQVIPQGVWTGSELVVWGGWGNPIAAAYNPVTDTWRDLPPGPLGARESQAIVAWRGRVAVLGGRAPMGSIELNPDAPPDLGAGWHLDAAVVDPATGQWTQLPDLPAGDPRAPGLVVAAEFDGRLFVVSRVDLHAFVLDADGTSWSSLGSPDVGSAGMDGQLVPVAVSGDQWLFAPRDPADPEFEPPQVGAVLDLAGAAWSTTSPPSGLAAEYLGAGAGDRVLAMAGRWAFDSAPPQAMSWEPTTGTWTELAPPPLAHRLDAAVAWTGDELLVWGGESTGGFGGPGLADGAALQR